MFSIKSNISEYSQDNSEISESQDASLTNRCATCRLIACGRDSEGNALIPGFTYGLYVGGLSPALGGVFAVWDGRAFLNDVTGEAVCLERAGYTHGMLMRADHD